MFSIIEEYFGVKCKMLGEVKIKGLPIYLVSGRSFYKCVCEGIEFYVVEISSDDKFGAVSLEKQLNIYQNSTHCAVSYYFDKLSKAQRDALVKRRIPFIFLDKQLYLPFLGVALNNRFSKNKSSSAKKMMPATQMLYLYLLYSGKQSSVMKSQAAKELNLTKTSISRASEQLLEFGLIKQERKGKETLISVSEDGYDSFEKAKCFLINPVQKKETVRYTNVIQNWPLSGESALGLKTDLNVPELMCVAVDKNNPVVNEMQVIDTKWEVYSECIEVEKWKYNPMLFQKDGLVDPVSLYMIMKDDIDERVEEALEKYMEELKW